MPKRKPVAGTRLRGLMALAVAVAAVVVVCVGVATSGAAPTAKKAASGKTLVMLDTEVAPSMDPDGADAADPALQQAFVNQMEPLIRYPATPNSQGINIPNYKVGPEGFQPDLATSWTQKGLTWTFHLRHNVKSCAGDTFTAADVIYSWKRAASVSGAAPVAYFLGFVAGIFNGKALAPGATAMDKMLQSTEVKEINPYTVQFTQLHPDGLFPRVLEIFPLWIYDSKVMLAHATKADPWSHNYTDNVGAPGFGAYCISSWVKGSQITFKSNPHYWAGQPQYTTVIDREVPSDADRIAAIESGQANVVTSLTPQEIAAVSKSSSVSVMSWMNNKILDLGINTKYAPFNNPTKGGLIRKAIAYAMPYSNILKDDYLGTATKMDGLFPASSFGFESIDTYNTNIAKAKALMAQAGYPNGKGLPSNSPAFQLNYVAERSSLLQPIATEIKTALAQIGINIQLEPIPQAEENTRELTKFDMGMFLRDYNRPLGPDVGYATLLWYVCAKDGGLEPSVNYCDPKLDAVFNQSQNSTGAKRLGYLHQIQQILMVDLPFIPIANVPSQLVVQKGITGWEGNGYDLVEYWYLKAPK